MADIAKDLAWMRGHAAQQATEDDRLSRERDAASRAVHRMTCWFCFHEQHVIDYGGGLDGVVVLWCRNPTCLCGIPPCHACGERVRPTVIADAAGNPLTECPFCRHQMVMAAYA